jgi:hypothetical protein
MASKNYTNKSSGKQKFPPIQAKDWIQPMVDGYLNILTSEWRKPLDKNIQVILLTDVILRQVDQPKKGESISETPGKTPLQTTGKAIYAKNEEGTQGEFISGGQDLQQISRKVRSEAIKYINTTKAGPIKDLNLRNASGLQFHYIVVANFAAANKFFNYMRGKGLIRKAQEAEGPGTQRGHTKAAARYHVESELKKLRKLSSEGGGAQKAAADLQKNIEVLATALTANISLGTLTKLDKLMRLTFKAEVIFLSPETAFMNLSKAQEKQIRNRITALIDEFVTKYGEDYLNVTSSKSIIQTYSDTVSDLLMDKKIKSKRSSSKSKYKKRNTKKPRSRIAVAKVPGGRVRPRTSDGKFTSPMNIQAILDAKIKETVADNMGKGGALVYRTGRFAQSVGVEKVMQSRQGTLTAFYTYMKTREYHPGGFKWGHLGINIRAYVHGEEPLDELEKVLYEIETQLDADQTITYDTGKTTEQITVLSIATDEGLLAPYGVGEITCEIRYQVV